MGLTLVLVGAVCAGLGWWIGKRLVARRYKRILDEAGLTYRTGLKPLADIVARTQAGYRNTDGFVPSVDDLADAVEGLVAENLESGTGKPHDFVDKTKALAAEFVGQPKVCLINAQAIALLRRRDYPPQTSEIFQTLWRDHGEVLCAHLSARWKASTLLTFAERGETEAQRKLGHAMTVLLGTMRIYETERQFARPAPDQPFVKGNRHRGDLFMGFPAMSVQKGDLDRHMFGRLYRMAKADPIAGPLALSVLNEINQSDKTAFARLSAMKND